MTAVAVTVVVAGSDKEWARTLAPAPKSGDGGGKGCCGGCGGGGGDGGGVGRTRAGARSHASARVRAGREYLTQ